MLIAKGYNVSFKMGSGRVSAPKRYAMLHDPEGRTWPANSVLVAPFSKDGLEIDDDFAESYFGDPPMGGSIVLPPRVMREWSEVGAVEKIEYSRVRPYNMPTKYEGDYYHFFDGSEGALSVLSLFFKAPTPTLYRRRRALRLELPQWASLNERGFIWP